MTQCGEPSANAKIGPSNCKFCRKPGLTILPLRYGTLSADDLSVLPKLDLGALGTQVKDKAIKHSKYTVRLLRPGYLYTLEERKGLSWRGYKITPQGQLFEFKIEDPAPLSDEKFECDVRPCCASAAAVTIPKPEEVPNYYLLYTVDPLSLEKRDEYKKNAAKYAGEGKMRVIHPNAFSPSPQEHAIKPAELSNYVLEYWLFDKDHAKQDIFKAPYADVLKDQLFPPLPYLGSSCDGPKPAAPAAFKRLGRLRDILTKDQGAGIVLPDPIGITQELNNFRNGAFTRLNEFLKEKDKYQVDNLRKFVVHNAIEEIRVAFEKGILQKGDRNYEYQKQQNQAQYQSMMERARYLRQRGNLTGAEQMERRAEVTKQRRDQFNEDVRAGQPEIAQASWSKYAKLLDEGELRKFQATIDDHSKRSMVAAEARADDHLVWLKAKELVDAFDTYDRQAFLTGQNTSSLGFYAQANMCLFGMEGTKKGADLLDNWITSLAIPRESIYMRAVFFNNEDLEKAAVAAMAKAKQLAAGVQDVSQLDKKINDTFKKVISGFKSVDSAWDEWIRNQSQYKNFNLTMTGDIFHGLSNITRAIFRRGAGGKLDKGVVAALGGVLYSSLGELTKEIEFKAIMDKTQAAHPEKFEDGHKGRSAERNKEMAERHAEKKADKFADQAKPALGDVLDDAKKYSGNPNLGDVPNKEISPTNRPATNNYHQVRIGVALGGLEMLSLGLKWRDLKKDDLRSQVDFAGSLLSLASITADTGYAALKSIREIDKYSDKGKLLSLNKAADIQRGGWKLASGSLGALAGGCSAVLDFMSATDEAKKYKANRVLVGVYIARGGSALIGLALVAAAAFTYTEPLINHLIKKNVARYGGLKTAGTLAFELAKKRVLLLIWVARFNLIGLAFTAVEIIYRVFFMDDDLQAWCKMSTFRKDKVAESALTKYSFSVVRVMYDTDTYDSQERELEELYKAFQEVQ